MTLTKLLPLIFFLLLGFNAFTQSDSSKKVDVNFLFNYYDQEGDHSAVTGGKGTQELQDVAGKIVMKVNLDSASTLFTGLSLNRYSSASTDRIDSRLSSASAIDYHLEVNVGYEKRINDKLTKGGNFYSAVESDYISMGLGYSLKRKKVKNGTYGLKINGFYDSWIIIYPEELRRANFRMVHTDKRYSLNLSQSYTWNMSRRMKASFNLDLTWQSGLLSTPFHRVYFSDTAAVSVEQLPGNRIKIPVGFPEKLLATVVHPSDFEPKVLHQVGQLIGGFLVFGFAINTPDGLGVGATQMIPALGKFDAGMFGNIDRPECAQAVGEYWNGHGKRHKCCAAIPAFET